MKKILYSFSNCQDTKQIKEFLQNNNIFFKEVIIDDEEKKKETIK